MTKQIDITDVREEIVHEIEEAEDARREREYQEKLARERAARVVEKNAVIVQLLPHLKGEGAWHNADKGTLAIDAFDVTSRFYLEDEYRSLSSWRTEPNGRKRLVVLEETLKWNRAQNRNVRGDVRRSFPQRKDGSFNYKEAASCLVAYAQRRRADAITSRNKEANENVAASLRNELGLSEYYGPLQMSPSAVVGKPVSVKVSFSAAMTVDEARAVHAALKSLGVITEKK